jgi:hypothetical protein
MGRLLFLFYLDIFYIYIYYTIYMNINIFIARDGTLVANPSFSPVLI